MSKSTLAIGSAGKVSVIGGLGFISALLVDIVIVGQFGLSRETDVLFIAFTIPQLIASISLVVVKVALVPLFAKLGQDQGIINVWKLTNNLINGSFLLFIPISLLGILTSPFTITLLGAGLNQPTKNLAIELNRILFLMIIPIGATEVIKATLNASRSFVFPAATTIVKNVSVLFTLIFTSSPNINVVAAGYVIATFVQFSFLMLRLLIKGFRYNLVFYIDDKSTQEALQQMRHPLIGAILGQGDVLIERFLASFLPFGIVSAIGYAKRILRAVDSIFLGSVTTAFLPYLSSQSTNNEIANYKNILNTLIRLLIFISFWISGLIIGLSESVIQLLFERTAFNANDTVTIAFFLNIYMISIPAWAFYQAVQTSFYSRGDTKRPFIFKTASFVLNANLHFALFFVLKAPGLALALTLTRIIITLFSARVLHRNIQIIDSNLILFLARILLATLLFGTVTFVLQGHFEFTFLDPQYASLLDISIRAIIGSLIFSLCIIFLRVQEVFYLFQQLNSWLRS